MRQPHSANVLASKIDAASADDQQRQEEAERRRGLDPARWHSRARPGGRARPRRWRRRRTRRPAPGPAAGAASRAGWPAAMPAPPRWSSENVGSRPTAKVEPPITTMVTRKVYLRPDEVADAAEDEGAERAHQEARRVGGESREQRRRVVAGRKEQRGEERRQRGVEIEVVPLEDGAERGGAKMTRRSSPRFPSAARRRLQHWQSSCVAPPIL